jgi:hypothetical protein
MSTAIVGITGVPLNFFLQKQVIMHGWNAEQTIAYNRLGIGLSVLVIRWRNEDSNHSSTTACL